MKYKIINSDILLNGKIIPENSEVDLTEEQTKGIESFLIPLNIHPEPCPELVSGSEAVSGSSFDSLSENKNKIKTKLKGNKK